MQHDQVVGEKTASNSGSHSYHSGALSVHTVYFIVSDPEQRRYKVQGVYYFAIVSGI